MQNTSNQNNNNKIKRNYLKIVRAWKITKMKVKRLEKSEKKNQVMFIETNNQSFELTWTLKKFPLCFLKEYINSQTVLTYYFILNELENV